MGVIKETILDFIEKKGKVDLLELYRNLKIHPGVLERVLRELEREGKIRKIKVKKPHNPRKFVVYYEI